MAAALQYWKRISGGRSCHGKAVRTVLELPCGWNSNIIVFIMRPPVFLI